ncbi:uncharacterized protein LOC130689183 [Daphnia carinata]|uniref:uncharacterized protein LOC130689183 n=1 Tax=Daphnia carinata TaxID=120202 RepID=UPI00257BA2E9|nr:uncharacterized protein LOC130689183 [Daphnia carinata]
MAQQNQPNNNLGGFADARFILINGRFWDSHLTRRYVQGQVWLNEFTNLLLESFLQIRGSPMHEKMQWNKNTKKYEPSPCPLEQFGSFEILKYGMKHAFTLYKPHEFNPMIFARRTQELLTLRNDMTHEVGRWAQANPRDTLEKLLKKMTVISKYLLDCRRHDFQLHRRIRNFKSNCEKELDQMQRWKHENMY